jgi:hypothetical protein
MQPFDTWRPEARAFVVEQFPNLAAFLQNPPNSESSFIAPLQHVEIVSTDHSSSQESAEEAGDDDHFRDCNGDFLRDGNGRRVGHDEKIPHRITRHPERTPLGREFIQMLDRAVEVKKHFHKRHGSQPHSVTTCGGSQVTPEKLTAIRQFVGQRASLLSWFIDPANSIFPRREVVIMSSARHLV